MKPVVAVFAHPDDEVFGPGGTMALMARERDVYIICITNGDAGLNSLKDSNNEKSLSEIRPDELRASAAAIGVKEVFFLGYVDGTLSNSVYHEIADKVQLKVQELDPEILLTYEPRGVSGHIDHVAASMITSYVFEHSSVQELWYYCMNEYARSFQKPYFIYFPPGYKDDEISKVVDIEPVWDQKVEAMLKHESQKHDIENILGAFRKRRKEEYFLIMKRTDLPKIDTE
jgi:N-acetylglucosamine malate deacetylase 2